MKRSKPRWVRRRRNDAPWRQECLERRGEWCRVAGCPHPQPVQIDHLIPRSQGGPSVVENGLPLCRRHHDLKTAHDMLINPAWLDTDQVLWLADHGHAEWLLDGVVVGRHRRLFADGPDRWWSGGRPPGRGVRGQRDLRGIPARFAVAVDGDVAGWGDDHTHRTEVGAAGPVGMGDHTGGGGEPHEVVPAGG